MARIALTLIDPPTWDSRLPKTGKALKDETDKIAALRKSMDEEGQLTPIEVEQSDNGRYVRVFGGRRLAAASLAPAWEAIEATVRPATAGNERMIRNIVENEKRENLTTYETARACAAMREAGLKDEEISGKLGKSKTHCSNSARAYLKLPEPIKEDWRNGHPAADVMTLFAIASDKEYPTPEKKQEAWDDHVRKVAAKEGRADKGKERGEGDGEKGGNAGYPISQKRFKHVYESLSVKGSPDMTAEDRKLVKAVLDFVIQAKANPPAGIPPLPVKASKATKDKDADKDEE